MNKYKEAARYFGEDAEFANGSEIDPLAAASEADDDDDNNEDITIDKINWDIPEEVINEAYADAYRQKAQAEDMQLWIAEHPVETIKMLATHLDGMANNYQGSEAGRYTRIAATEAHKLHWLLMGSDEAISELNEVPGW